MTSPVRAEPRPAAREAGVAPSARRGPPADACAILTVAAALLLLVPARLVVGPVGAAGTPAGLFGLGLLLWWIANRLAPSPAIARGITGVHVGVGLLGCAILGSYVSATVQGLRPDELRSADRGLLALAAWTGLAFAACDLLRSRASVERLLRRLVVLGAIVAAIGAVQFIGFDLTGLFRVPGLQLNAELDLVGRRGVLARVSGTATHYIEFGVVLAMLAPFAFHVAMHARRRRLLWWSFACVIAAGIPLSVSRSAILGAGAALVLMSFVWTPRQRLIALAVLPAVIATVRLVMPGMVGTFISMFTNTDDSVRGRTDDYALVGSFVQGSQWLGRGFRTFLPAEFFILDNQYLGALVELGIIGLLAMALLLAIAVGLGRGIRRRAPDAAAAHLGQCFVASSVAAAIAMGTFDGLGFPLFANLLFLLLGCAGALWRAVSAPRLVCVVEGG